MNKRLLLSFLSIAFLGAVSFGQCDETYALCTKQLSKEDLKAGWNVNKQSESVSFEKGQVYETTLMAHKGLEYRLSVCTDADGGTAATFQLAQDVMVTVTDSSGNSSIERQRKIIFDNTTENPEQYVLYRSDKTEKYYLSIHVPATGKSKTKKLKNTEFVCVGVRLEHRKAKNSAL